MHTSRKRTIFAKTEWVDSVSMCGIKLKQDGCIHAYFAPLCTTKGLIERHGRLESTPPPPPSPLPGASPFHLLEVRRGKRFASIVRTNERLKEQQ